MICRVPGVAEINAWGGYKKQFEARVDPIRLAQHELTLDEVMSALRTKNQNAGGGYVVRSGEASLVLGVGRRNTTEEIAEMHSAIRQRLVHFYGPDGSDIRILYGGSVKASNAPEIFAVADVDGALVGGASLTAADFIPIVAAAAAS